VIDCLAQGNGECSENKTPFRAHTNMLRGEDKFQRINQMVAEAQ
jgi:hypothetical protein